MTNMHTELVAFRYVPKDKAEAFSNMLNGWGVSLLGPKLLQLNSTSETMTEPAPSVPANLWDYPDYEEEHKTGSGFFNKVSLHNEKLRLQLTDLKDINIVYIKDVPDHYPYTYVVGFTFALKSTQLPTDKHDLLNQLNAATWEIKRFTDIISRDAPYRPVYWFLSGLPENLVGIRGVPMDVLSPDGNLNIKIERGFPYASYVIYNVYPSQSDLRITDLALVSVIAHSTERGYREELHTITQDILKSAKAYTNKKQEKADKTIPGLKEDIKQLLNVQSQIQPNIEKFYDTRRRLIRSKGLVQRVKQICGGPDNKKTYLDIVCEDALSLISDEFAMSQEEITTSFKGVSDRLNAMYNELNNEYNQMSSSRSQELQKLGYLLQSTGIAFIVFQISDKLLYPAGGSQSPLQGAELIFRAIILILITIAAGITTYFVLQRSFATREVSKA